MVQFRLLLILLFPLLLIGQVPKNKQDIQGVDKFLGKYSNDISQFAEIKELLKIVYNYEYKTDGTQVNNRRFILYSEIGSDGGRLTARILSIDDYYKRFVNYELKTNVNNEKIIGDITIESFNVKKMDHDKTSSINDILNQIRYQHSLPNQIRYALVQGQVAYLVVIDSDDVISMRLGSCEDWSIKLKNALSGFFKKM